MFASAPCFLSTAACLQANASCHAVRCGGKSARTARGGGTAEHAPAFASSPRYLRLTGPLAHSRTVSFPPLLVQWLTDRHLGNNNFPRRQGGLARWPRYTASGGFEPDRRGNVGRE